MDHEYPDKHASTSIRWMIGIYAVLLPSLFAWGSWITVSVMQNIHELKYRTQDRFSGSSYIDIQAELKRKNPDIDWLTPGEVREIQQRNGWLE